MSNPAQPATVTFRGRTFKLEQTGGGCTAYVHTDDAGNETLITRTDTADAPAFGEPATVSLFTFWTATAENGDSISGTDFESSYNVPAFIPDDMTADQLLYAAAGIVRALGDVAEAAGDSTREADYIDLSGEIWTRTEEGIRDTTPHCEGCSEMQTVGRELHTYAITFRDGSKGDALYCGECADTVNGGEGDNVASAVRA